MVQSKQQWPGLTTTSALRTEEVLERYYGQLVEWGTLLTRGDRNRAQDLVHDFCLHFTVTKPNLNGITNLDGYLYKCLRHIYLSGLTRSSREALQFVGAAEFDSIQLALAPRGTNDPLQRQNDLRRICSYAVWRKNQTKSASYFILRFFHGYHHQEIATLAGTPIAAIYTKFRAFRVEVRSYLEEPSKVQFITGDVPPVPALRWARLASIDLFNELRQTILGARTGDCVPDEGLIALYRSEPPKTLPCSLLSHIVSCERCLVTIDRYLQRPTLKDREPLDHVEEISDDPGSASDKPRGPSGNRLLRAAQRYGAEVLEHRPRVLSIAVDGKILASHDVQSQRNVLSARIDRPETTCFIEVFSELGIRLALLSVGDLPPEGPHQQSQRVVLSDQRWLSLRLCFDGLGLMSEVVYCDPTLVPDLTQDDENVPVRRWSALEARPVGNGKALSRPGVSRLLGSLRRILDPLAPSPAMAWALMVAAIVCGAGYLANRIDRTPSLNARELLSQSMRIEVASLRGQTEHQVLRMEEATADGRIIQQGTIDLWKDGDGKRIMRRIYDADHRLVGAEWADRGGNRGEYPGAEDSEPSSAGRALLADKLWKQDLSPSAFREWNGENAQIHTTEDGYELTVVEPVSSHPQFIFVSLVFDLHLHAVREVMRFRSGRDVREVRLVQVDDERRPASSVPDAVFDPRDQGLLPKTGGSSNRSAIPSKVALAELHIGVLYELNRLGADTSEPIEVDERPDARVHVLGTVSDDVRKQQILECLNLLENHRFLDIQLLSPTEVQRQASKSPRTVKAAADSFEVGQAKAPADSALRGYFQKQGLSGTAVDAAAQAFSRDALAHAQRALQHVSALHRLASTIHASELRSVRFKSQQQWTELVAKHGAAAEVELRAFHDQLVQLSPVSGSPLREAQLEAALDSPEQFARETNRLLLQTQGLNRTVGRFFASGQRQEVQEPDVDSLVETIREAIPLQQATEIRGFAARLNASGRTLSVNRLKAQLRKPNPNRD